MTKFEYTVYETSAPTKNPRVALRPGHPVAHYDNYHDMVNDWLLDLSVGTHVFTKTMVEN